MNSDSSIAGTIPDDWKTVTIGELCEAIYDGPHATPRKTENGPIFLGISNLAQGRLDLSSVEHLSEDDFETWTRRVTPRVNDVVFSYETRLGEAALVPENLRCCLGRRMALMRPNTSRVVPRFLLYAFLSPEFQQTIRSRTIHGSTVDRIALKEFPSFPIRIPPLPEQRAIAHILGTLDDKIELNRRMNATLEAMARAIFKSWFVDFDPVHAKARGEQPAGMDAETAALFPDSFEESELGLIPAGWRVGTLGEIAQNPRESADPESIDPNTPYIGLEHMPQRSIALGEWGYAEQVNSNKHRFKRHEFLFGKLRPYFHKVGVAPLEGICSTDILVITAKASAWYGLVLGHISSTEFVDYTTAVSTGTRMPRTNWRDMSRYEIVIPSDDLAAAFSDYVISIVNAITNNIFQSSILAEVRNTLLPKLILGEIRVGGIE